MTKPNVPAKTSTQSPTFFTRKGPSWGVGFGNTDLAFVLRFCGFPKTPHEGTLSLYLPLTFPSCCNDPLQNAFHWWVEWDKNTHLLRQKSSSPKICYQTAIRLQPLKLKEPIALKSCGPRRHGSKWENQKVRSGRFAVGELGSSITDSSNLPI